jgi:hypothetical protein
MAPDISQISFHDKDVTQAETYQIPDILFRDPKNRRLRVLTIGAGVSGIMMAYHIQKQCQKYQSTLHSRWTVGN